MSLKPMITVVGSLNYDSTKFLKQMPNEGETVTAVGCTRTGPGGKGGNQALAALRMSCQGPGFQSAIDVTMVGAVGTDAMGEEITVSLQRDGIDTSRIKPCAEEPTGEADIWILRNAGESRVCLVPGANYSLRPEDFETVESLTGPRGNKPDLLILQLEIPRNVVEKVIETARRSNIPVLLNAAPASNLLVSVWKLVTHLIVNEVEAAMLTRGSLEMIRNDAHGTNSAWKAVARELIQKGPKYVVITLGANGVVYADDTGKSEYREAVNVERVIDTTTAGDTFVGAYAAAVVQQRSNKWDMDRAVAQGLKAAAYCVAKAGTQTTIPWAGSFLDRRDSVYEREEF